MDLYCGTSGYAYDEWSGNFYPDDLAKDERLSYYASRLNTVEINNTFYRAPRQGMVTRWAEAVPDTFRLVIKANQRITHRARLGNVAPTLEYFLPAVLEAGEKLGPILFQTPPNLKKDAGRLREFFGQLDGKVRAAMEFRNDSWDDEETRQILSDAGAAWVTAEEDGPGDVHETADFGYVRLRQSDPSEGDVDRWRERLSKATWQEAYVFFKHEDGGVAPALAEALLG